jgi:surfactin synthase thioesterase subunit
MNRKLLLALAGAAAGAFMAYGTAQAAPMATGPLEALKTLGIEQPQVEQAHWRRRSHWRRCHRRWRSGWRC